MGVQFRGAILATGRNHPIPSSLGLSLLTCHANNRSVGVLQPVQSTLQHCRRTSSTCTHLQSPPPTTIAGDLSPRFHGLEFLLAALDWAGVNVRPQRSARSQRQCLADVFFWGVRVPHVSVCAALPRTT